MSEVRSREWHLVRRPEGRPVAADVDLVSVTVGEPEPGWVRVANSMMSLEPSMRGRMDERATSYVSPYKLGSPMEGFAVGTVTASSGPELPVGSTVIHERGWREHALVPVDECRLVDPSPDLTPVQLTLLGLIGMTAWVGVTRVARLQPGEVLYVNSAAGGVGSVVVQLAKILGATVVASAGSAEKVDLVRGLGADVVFDHREGRTKDQLRAALDELGAPGFDVVFENVGGEQLEAALGLINDHARIALCGMISLYNSATPMPGPRNLIRVIWRRATIQGFLLRDHLAARPEFEAQMAEWIRGGRVRAVQHVEPGIESAWGGFLGMLDGTTPGKTLVSLVATDTAD